MYEYASRRYGSWCVSLVVLSMLLGCRTEMPESWKDIQQARLAARPNVVLIVADDLGFGDLGCYGQEKIKTPNLDRLAAEGMKFTQAYGGGKTTQATWWCMMTGKFATWASDGADLKFELRPKRRSLSRVVRAADYRTGFVGQWSFGIDEENQRPNKNGFDWSVVPDEGAGDSNYPASICRDGKIVDVAPDAEGEAPLDLNALYTREAIDYLTQSKARQPFFLVVAYALPHGPAEPAKDSPYADLDWPEDAKAYASRVTRLDQEVGRLLDTLSELEIDERTTVMFTSDNGPQVPEGSDLSLLDSTAGLRGAQGDLYEGGIRVPLIVRWPNQVAAGTESDYPAASWDFMPTIAAIAGSIIPSAATDGVALTPVLLGGAGRTREIMHWEVLGEEAAQAVRIGDWKAVRPPGDAALGSVQLYDLKEDPYETKDVADERPEIRARFIVGIE